MEEREQCMGCSGAGRPSAPSRELQVHERSRLPVVASLLWLQQPPTAAAARRCIACAPDRTLYAACIESPTLPPSSIDRVWWRRVPVTGSTVADRELLPLLLSGVCVCVCVVSSRWQS